MINDSSGARVALASSSYAADLGLMSCNKTWPSTPEIALQPSAALAYGFYRVQCIQHIQILRRESCEGDDDGDDEENEDKKCSQGSTAFMVE